VTPEDQLQTQLLVPIAYADYASRYEKPTTNATKVNGLLYLAADGDMG